MKQSEEGIRPYLLQIWFKFKRLWTLWFPMGILMSPSGSGWAPVALVISPLVSLMHDQAWNWWIWALVDCHGTLQYCYCMADRTVHFHIHGLKCQPESQIPMKVWRSTFRMRFKLFWYVFAHIIYFESNQLKFDKWSNKFCSELARVRN